MWQTESINVFLLPPNFPVFRPCLWDNYSCVTLTLIKNSLSCNEISVKSFCIKIQSIHLDPPPTWYADNVENKLLYISSYSKYLEGLDQFSFTIWVISNLKKLSHKKVLLHFTVVTESNGRLNEVWILGPECNKHSHSCPNN